MKKLLFLIPVILIGFGAWGVLSQKKVPAISPNEVGSPGFNEQGDKVLAQNLDTPWAIAFLPDTSLLFTERQGSIKRITPNGTLQKNPVATIANAKEVGEGGLLGIAVHPEFPNKPYVYVYYTYKSEQDNTLNRLSRFTYTDGEMSKEEILINAIPGASNHNGGVIRFGPDGNLYIGTGDSQQPTRAQDTKNLAGKILRVTDGGQPVAGNPFKNEVYSYGHRNVQGIAWDQEGTLYATEHGRSGIRSGLDELNKIVAGQNYGWPDIEGDKTKANMITPEINSGSTTWAPASLAFSNGSFYFGGLRGQALYKTELKDGALQEVSALYSKTYGRIRAVTVGPDNALYISTSNNDGRGSPHENDDKIIRIQPN